MSDIQAQAKRDAEFDRLLCYESDKVVYDAADMTDAYEMGKRHGRVEGPRWQPIDTAPKDGTDILVYVPTSGEQFVVYWHKEEVWAHSITPTGAIGYCEPTLWMPLPEPPKVTP